MGHLLCLALFALVALALIVSLVINARQFFQLKDLEGVIQELQSRLVGPGGKIGDAVEGCIRNFTSELDYYRGGLGDQRALDAIALRNLGEDLPVLLKIGGYAESAGWPHAMVVLAGIRLRMIIGKLVLAQSPDVPPAVVAGMEQLLGRLRSFSGLQGMYYDFYQGHLMAVKPPREEERKWPDEQLAEMTAADTESEAKQVLALMRPPAG